MRRLLVLDAGGAASALPWSGAERWMAALAGLESCDVCWRDLSTAAPLAASAVRAIRHWVSGPLGRGQPSTLVLLGSLPRQGRVLWALVAAGLRPRIQIVLHVPAAEVPLPPGSVDLLVLADAIVTESAFGAQLVENTARHSGQPLRVTTTVIPPLVDWDGKGSPAPTSHTHGDAGAMRLVVGCCVSDGWDGRGFLAVQIVRALIQGWYWECARCGATTAFDVDDTLAPIGASACAHCGATERERGVACAHVQLRFIMGAAAPRARSSRLHQWTVLEFAEACGVSDHVSVVRATEGTPEASRLTVITAIAELDVHLLPHDAFDLEPPVLASCALGIPTIVTGCGAATDPLAPPLRLARPRVYTWSSDGAARPLMDVGDAVEQLRALVQSRDARRQLGEMAKAAMHQQRPAMVAARWRALLSGLWNGASAR